MPSSSFERKVGKGPKANRLESLNVRGKVTPEADSSETKESPSEVKIAVHPDVFKVNSSKADTTASPREKIALYLLKTLRTNWTISEFKKSKQLQSWFVWWYFFG